MSGIDLKDAVARGLRSQGPLFVHSPLLDAGRLNRQLEAYAGAGQVTPLDCTEACPAPDVLEKAFAEGLRPGRVLHVQVKKSLPEGLWGALVRVAADGKLPGRSSTSIAEGLLVLSAKTLTASELNEELGSYFPLRVGVVS